MQIEKKFRDTIYQNIITSFVFIILLSWFFIFYLYFHFLFNVLNFLFIYIKTLVKLVQLHDHIKSLYFLFITYSKYRY